MKKRMLPCVRKGSDDVQRFQILKERREQLELNSGNLLNIKRRSTPAAISR